MNFYGLNKKNFFCVFCLILFFVAIHHSVGYGKSATTIYFQEIPQDTTKRQDTVKTSGVKPSVNPYYNFRDRYGDPLSNPTSPSPFLLNNPSNYRMNVEVDTGMNYTITEKMGDLNYRSPYTLSFEQYDQLHSQSLLRNYWKDRSAGLDGESAVSGRRLIPPIYISPVFDRIFGGSYVDIQPNGFVTLDFGGKWQRVQNPQIPIRQQRNGGFVFDQQISMNVVGKIGEKMAITANFDNNNSFDFENDLKVEYTGFEEDIIQKIEIGNVSLPLQNSLITGAQNLFGVKTQLRFGKMYVTAVASTQRGKSEAIEINTGVDGGQGREFEIRASEYDENRHFFLGHFFRENYEAWLRTIPQINSGVYVQRVEVYVMNLQSNTQTLRNIAGFMDLAESEVIYNPTITSNNIPQGANSNTANNLFSALRSNPSYRSVDQINQALNGNFGMIKGTDYEIVNTARKLDEREYTFNRELGLITLTRKLQNDEVLAVAYEYTYRGQTYKVGELTDDYQNIPADQIIFLKLLRPAKINTRVPTWDLMMKNVYSLNASQITRDAFQLRVIYRDDKSGIDNPSLHEGINTKDIPLIQLAGLDRLNPNNDPQRDGNFDFVEGVTIIPETGLLFFPVLEPFGTNLRQKFDPNAEAALINKYVYDTLYHTTKAEAELDAYHNKYWIVGRMQAGSASEITLPGINIAPGSVVVTAGNTPLIEDQQYRVDYNLGRVIILDESILNSGKPIRITFEKADLFNFQTRSLLGTRFDYRISENFTIGSTFLYHNERPYISRVSIGDEPTRNIKYGFDINYQNESRFLTKMVDALPLIQTKEPSHITFNAEFAQLLPGTSNKVNGEGTSYIDDFESTATPFSLGNSVQNWKLASTPRTSDNRFTRINPNTATSDAVEFGYKRAKMAWYIVDNVFYRNSGVAKPEISPEDLSNHYMRGVSPQEIFTGQDRQVLNTNLGIFDIAYYPRERGPYNFNPSLTNDGLLAEDPEDNWAGISRAITSDVDFDRNNIEYIEFWLMDPFIDTDRGTIFDGRNSYTASDRSGGKLVFNLGNISEDVIKDNKHAFENGLPPNDDTTRVTVSRNKWGVVTNQQYLTNAFDNSTSARANQDVGWDGLKSSEELSYPGYEGFVNAISPQALDAIQNDLTADDFRYYLGDEFDAEKANILVRYKNYNNMEGNSPVQNNNPFYTPSGTNLPDNEDLNKDNTINDVEEYFEYSFEIDRNTLNLNNPYIVDKVEKRVGQGQGQDQELVSWYLVRIPIREPTGTYGDINSYKSIRFMRMYLTGFRTPVVLRMANLQLVGAQWRKYTGNLYDRGLYEKPEPYNPNFFVSVVNVEENGSQDSTKIPYVVPPGIRRDFDNTSPIVRRNNEQSMSLCVDDLEDKDARAVFKNVNLDLINYGKMKMFIHAESKQNAAPIEDDDINGFLRLGTDFESNYYEIELPLKITTTGTTSPEEIWPAENEIDIDLDVLSQVKKRRDAANYPIESPYSQTVGKYVITVRGRPNLLEVGAMMIGIRNPESSPDESPKSVCIWVNELRVSDFDRTPGWAANAYLGMRLADLGTVNASTRYTSFGFGGVQSRIQERTREEILEYDVSANINLDKFLPENTGIKIPAYASYEKRIITPKYDPIDPDITLEASLDAFDNADEREEYKNIMIDQTTRRSFNFTNVRKEKVKPDAKKHIYDIENFSFTYAYSETERSNHNIASYELRSNRGAIAYNYSPNPLELTPLKNSKSFNSPYLQLIKDFNVNFAPSNLNFRVDVDRKFARTQLRNDQLGIEGILPTWEKYFFFNRIYGFSWNLTKSLSFDYNARVTAIVDEPEGDIDTEKKREVIKENFYSLGRTKNFNQSLGLNYRLPLDKIPLTNWVSADARYAVGYNWTAGAYSPDPELNQQAVFGNMVENSQDINLNGKVDFVKLYNKVNYLKSINSPPRRRPNARPNPNDTTEAPKELKAVKGILRLLMSVRSVNVNYSIRSGTLLPGYGITPFLLGFDSAWAAPGWKFMLGSQDPEIRKVAASEGWIVYDTLLTMPFTQVRQMNLDVKANIEPFQDLRIQLDAMKVASGNYEEQFRVDSNPNGPGGIYEPFTPSRSGSYRISYNIIKTSFTKDDDNFDNEIFDNFVKYRDIIRSRLGEEYAINSQDVLVPAFLAAYGKKDPNTATLSPFPKIPIPNWRVDYAGLSKIPALRDVFSSISITHGYRSSFNINSYTNSLDYDTDLELDNNFTYYPVATVKNENGEYVPVFLLGQVVIQEEFAPLIGINFRTKSKMTTRIEFRKKRDLALNFSNAQVTEVKSNDLTIDLGYTKAGMRLPFKDRGRVITLENDLSFKMTFTIRDTETIQRKIEDVNTPTNGNVNLQFRPQVSYVLNQRLNINVYFERSINTPIVSSSFKRTTTAGGVQIRFSLAQ